MGMNVLLVFLSHLEEGNLELEYRAEKKEICSFLNVTPTPYV